MGSESGIFVCIRCKAYWPWGRGCSCIHHFTFTVAIPPLTRSLLNQRNNLCRKVELGGTRATHHGWISLGHLRPHFLPNFFSSCTVPRIQALVVASYDLSLFDRIHHAFQATWLSALYIGGTLCYRHIKEKDAVAQVKRLADEIDLPVGRSDETLPPSWDRRYMNEPKKRVRIDSTPCRASWFPPLSRLQVQHPASSAS
jgi:hypothetical protein